MKTADFLRAGSVAASFSGLLAEALERMEAELGALCRAAGPLSGALERVTLSGGKRLRPALAWVCWRLAGGRGEIAPLMAMLELMHTASLVHDDLLDGAETRRGRATISAAEGPETAVRAGDFLLACAMTYLKRYRGTGINEALSAVSREMCLGEMEQRAGLWRPADTTRADCLRRIRRKTALLLAESCRCGCAAGGGDEKTCAAAREYGLHLGMAFQLRDDLGDLCGGGEGKPAMQDLRGGVVTLPLLLALEKDETLLPILEKQEKSPAECARVLERAARTGALEETRKALSEEIRRAIAALCALPPSPEREALEALAQALTEVS